MKNFILFLFVFLVKNIFAQDIYVVRDKLNMRMGPSKDTKLIKELKSGDTLHIVDKSNNDWWYVEHKEIQGYVSSNILLKWISINQSTGETKTCDNVIPKYDYSIDNSLLINVGKNTDVIVKLMNKQNNLCIRVVYVRGGESYEIKNIPEGYYYLKIAYGKDYSQVIDNNICLLKFRKNPIYEKGAELLDYNNKRGPDTYKDGNRYENWDIPSYELFLDVTYDAKGKTFKSNNISESEFNK